MKDPQTIAVYDQRAEDYQTRFSDDNPKALNTLITQLEDGARVLDLGCGPGHHARAMSKAGLKVTAMDASREMIALLEGVDGITLRLGTFDTLDDVAVFDAVWASFSLLHAPKSDLPAHLAAIFKTLKPGGRFVVGMKLGRGEVRDRLGRFYAYYALPELHDLLRDAGFTVTETQQGTGRGLAGTEDPFAVIHAHA